MSNTMFRRATAVGLLAAAVVAALIVVPGSPESPTPNGLFAFVVTTNRGPLPACSESAVDCTRANLVRDLIYVANLNRIQNADVFRTRATMTNAYVISSIDQAMYVNGAPLDLTAFSPPIQMTG